MPTVRTRLYTYYSFTTYLSYLTYKYIYKCGIGSGSGCACYTYANGNFCGNQGIYNSEVSKCPYYYDDPCDTSYNSEYLGYEVCLDCANEAATTASTACEAPENPCDKCSSNEVCDNQKCVPKDNPCDKCSSNQVCDGGKCVNKADPCDNCAAGTVCQGGSCVATTDPCSLCNSNQVCDGGSCVNEKCFPSHGVVQLSDGSSKLMHEISVGDVVRVSGNKYSPVFMFTHKIASRTSTFVQLTTVSNAKITLTHSHYLEVNGNMAAASTVRVGDHLTLANGTVSEVSNISELQSTGLFNPQTVEGSIVVDGIVASTYTTAVEMNTAHTLLSPLRAAYTWCGLSLSVLEQGADYLAGFLPNGKSQF